MTEYNPQAEYEAEKAAHEEQQEQRELTEDDAHDMRKCPNCETCISILREGLGRSEAENTRLRAEVETLLVSEDALARLVRLIDSAGISNLSNGVQLGQMSWHIKMTTAMMCARACLAETRRKS